MVRNGQAVSPFCNLAGLLGVLRLGDLYATLYFAQGDG
jgi:hypothetical protein